MPVSTIAVHGGAGTITTDIPPELQAAYRERLRASLRAGWKVLEDGGNSLDAVCASVKVLEDRYVDSSLVLVQWTFLG